jgi:SAM-dependent methyltransferase
MSSLTKSGAARLRGRLRYKLRQAFLALPKNVACNVCGWTGRRFVSDAWHEHVVCMRCRSQVRHRLMLATLLHHPGLTWGDLVDGKRVLHFAPEQSLDKLFRARAAKYTTADYMRDGVDLKLDMTNMPEVADSSVDLLVACDVLEHVPDVTAALRECGRVLAPGGRALFTIPQKDGLAKTEEDPSITSPEDRERVYGQIDHVRLFGNDLPEWIESVGLSAQVVEASSFSPAQVKRFVLFPPVLSKKPLATNYRKIYFARKT